MRDALLIAAVANARAERADRLALHARRGRDPARRRCRSSTGPSVIVDTVATCFVLPFLTTLVITTVIWKEMREGHLTRLPRAPGSFAERLPDDAPAPGDLDRPALPAASSARSSAVGVLLFDYGDISVGEFVLYKAIFGDRCSARS